MESRITKIENYLKTIVELIEDIKDLMNKTIVDSRNTKNLLIEANRIIQSSNKPNKIIKSAKHKAKRQFDLIIYQIKKLKKEIETLSNNNIDLNNLLPQIYKKYGINEINVNLLNVTKSLNFFIYQFTEIKSKLKYENFNFNGIISEINKIKIEDNYYLIPSVFENLLKIITDIYNNKEKISKEIYEKDTLILDVTKEFQDFSDAKNIISIIDADFIASLQKLTSDAEEKTLKLSFPGKIIMLKKIIKEVTYTPAGILHPLSSRKLISYFSEQLGATIIDPIIDEDKKEVILNLWKEFTYQGKKASQRDEQKFINSGDMSILFLCCKLNPQPIVIFSNNKSEIEKVGQILKDKNMAYIIRVVNFEEIYSKAIN